MKTSWLIVGCLVICQGCGTIAAYGPAHPTEEGRAIRQRYYPAVRMDNYAIRNLYADDSGLLPQVTVTPFLILDYPISACFDTIAVPFKWIELSKTEGRDGPNQASEAIGAAAPQPQR